MNAEEYFALIEARLDSYSVEETLARLKSYSQEGPTIDEYLSSSSLSGQVQWLEVFPLGDDLKLESGFSYFSFSELDVQYSFIDGACNDDNYFSMDEAIFELAA